MTIPRGSAREAIRAAAGRLFAEAGYARTSLRRVAREAGVDPSLVIRYFGSKEGLFLDIIRPDTEDVMVYSSTSDAVLGEAIVRSILGSDGVLRRTYLGLVRASDSPEVHSVLREMHETGFVAPMTARLTGPDPDVRARMIAAMVGGLMYALWIAEDDGLTPRIDTVVALYGAQLQGLITPSADDEMRADGPSAALPSRHR